MLEVKDLSFRIKDMEILNGVTLRVAPGETVGLIGPNGSGKTTLFNCVSGFHYPTTGTIHLKGDNITTMRPYKRALLGLGRVFQNFGVFRDMTVLENVVTALESRQSVWKVFFPWCAQHKVNRETAWDYLAEVGLTEKINQKAGSLSGGQMRLLEITRTLAFGADLFLLDEPTAGVSPKMKDDVAALIKKLQELGKTVLIIEHDINFIQKFCERIIVLDVGRVVLDGSLEEVRNSEVLKEIYFGKGEETSNG